MFPVEAVLSTCEYVRVIDSILRKSGSSCRQQHRSTFCSTPATGDQPFSRLLHSL